MFFNCLYHFSVPLNALVEAKGEHKKGRLNSRGHLPECETLGKQNHSSKYQLVEGRYSVYPQLQGDILTGMAPEGSQHCCVAFQETLVNATVRHLVSGVARARGGSEECCSGAFGWCGLHIELRRQGVRKQGRLTLMWTWMQDRQSCRRNACSVPLGKVSIDL